MSFDKIGGYDAMKSVQGTAGTNNVRGSARLADLQATFDNQMSMARNLFADEPDEYGENNAGSFNVSLINDSRMLEALATITRLMRNESGLRRASASAVAESGASSRTAATQQTASAVVPGALSASFESGEAGAGAIGYDRVGGTSYGKYQIASRPGTMDRFLTYLDTQQPAWADRLRNAGPANTGSQDGGMPEAWKALASDHPAAFEKAQHDFIAQETYLPAREMILKKTGLDFDNAPPALREVLWSTSVQHGATGAARIFNRVIDRFVDGDQAQDFNATLIKGVYDTRKGQFGSSTQQVQRSVANRMDTEKQLALSLLENQSLNRIV